MQKPTWNTHRYDVDRPQPRVNHQRRQPRHEPILDADAQRPHNVADDAHLMTLALLVPAVDPVPVILDTHLIPVALHRPAVDPESHVNETHMMAGDPSMPAAQREQQRTATVIASPAKDPLQLGQLVACPVDFPTAAPPVGQLLPVEPTSDSETTTQPLKTTRRAGPGVAAPYIAYVWTHHQVALKTTQVRPPTAPTPPTKP
ncbi:hypothetical protein Ae201684P_019070 [Aphanomyces euteiches]|nr:hypothetical protein Ae201684P_019070 [Aphanomyces euteiches]